MTAPWVPRDAGGADARVLLLCFAHAGGGTTGFRPWREPLGPEIAVWPVLLPGRESRLREPAHRRMATLVPELVDALAPALDRPYALFGHSTGAVVAYEAARALVARGVDPPVRLFASGRRAPHLPARHGPRHDLPEAAFLTALAGLGGTAPELLAEPGLARLFVPALRADFELNETYVPLPGPALTCPVSAMTGDADPEAHVDELAAWRDVTRGAFSLRTFAGDHFYLRGAPPALMRAVREDLLGRSAQQCADGARKRVPTS
ncbi:thioesterase II family protein [Saccharothrix longispora]|uniref:thioesterase II family protein n=1 Tax=Saccharothrix longispora TaxID=33920 RepID=UPI0028FD61C9|nr:thioesterase domain-containing protein [Saccharothrix longispora]MDU0291027.1 thioesterase domain-containing protein [Saccharothrix longispora]